MITRFPSIPHRTLLSCALAALGAFASAPALARSGTHAPAISTWDTRASSVVLHGQAGFLDGGHFHTIGYNANFTSTSGNLSAQFGMHYLNFQRSGALTQHGFAASATGLLSIPLTDRFDDGVPIAALGIYLGAVPTALFSGRFNDLAFPVVMGAGAPLSPASAITFTPWFEFAPTINLDTVIRPYFFDTPLNDLADLEDFFNQSGGQFTGIQDISVRKILEDSVEVRTYKAVTARGGLAVGLHASETMDLNLGVTFGSLGVAFSGPLVVQAGGGVVVRWDDIVPAVLPSDRRLLKEDCGAVARRHAMCEAQRGSAKPRGNPYGRPGAVPRAGPPAGPPAGEPVHRQPPPSSPYAPRPESGPGTQPSGSQAPVTPGTPSGAFPPYSSPPPSSQPTPPATTPYTPTQPAAPPPRPLPPPPPGG